MNCKECKKVYGESPCVKHGECPYEYEDVNNAREYESKKEFENNRVYE